jgi:hypothetical protein
METQLRDLAAHFRASFADNVPPFQREGAVRSQKGRREDRVRAAPAVSRAKVVTKGAHEHTGSAEAVRPSLRNGFTAYNVLSLATGCFVTIARVMRARYHLRDTQTSSRA